ncbi:hypothetical protein EHQ58_11960 [Leptospira ognonensis]|uniref:Uncharacterized protein n=2 Tax=Leptospira ognonensis TaxID=2484945 RepID=A0A4R9K1V4_9LEPT|nr:hypothetical protein EHQ58_11960 [Leptospira ognonensis]
MLRVWQLLIGMIFCLTPLSSQELILKDKLVLWQGNTLLFPEDVVIRETKLAFESSLHVYPARREPFFIVFRKLPLQELNFPKESWEREIFWRGKDLEKTTLEKNGILFTIYKADQIRNQNLLRCNLWIWTDQGSNYWVWILFRKERTDLFDFFENGRFLNSSGAN